MPRRRTPDLFLAALSLWAAGCGAPATADHDKVRKTHPLVAFMSDFGITDDSVALCKGVMLSVDDRIRVTDITHQVTPYDVAEAARYLAGCAPHFPANTVFVCVVDPGVGTERKPMVARSKRGQTFVLPDNGLITLIDQLDGPIEARELTNPAWRLKGPTSGTFHGRDIFSPGAAHIAAGEDWTKSGPVIDKPVKLAITLPKADSSGIAGTVIALDGPYGNLVTDIEAAEFAKLGWVNGDVIPVKIGERGAFVLPLVKTFGDVEKGKPLLYIDSRGRLAAAINMGDFAKTYNIKPPTNIAVRRKE